ncbi:hypothetical protein BH09BAC5_BH09BAC5_09130 [soil metagenome]
MGFFAKIKQKMGIGTVSVKIEMPETFTTESGLLSGKVIVTGKSEQIIEHVEVEFEEHYPTGSGDNKSTTKIGLGKTKIAGFSIKEGEVKEIPFELPFSYGKSKNEQMSGQGGLMGGLGKAGSFLNSEKSTFEFTATADVKGAALDPNATKTLKRAK